MQASLVRQTLLVNKVGNGFSSRRATFLHDPSRMTVAASNWLPGAAKPDYLPADMIGNFGYDPLGLGKDPAVLTRYQETELINGRWAMLGVAGAIIPEALGYADWVQAPNWALTGGKATYLGFEIPFDLKTLALIEIFAIGGAEAKRIGETDPEKRMYPGGPFDPLGFGKDPEKLKNLKLKEIKNGRLAMFCWAGYILQYIATGKGPYQNLLDHIADPWGVNFATNGVSLPF
eukprot:g2337.t1